MKNVTPLLKMIFWVSVVLNILLMALIVSLPVQEQG